MNQKINLANLAESDYLSELIFSLRGICQFGDIRPFWMYNELVDEFTFVDFALHHQDHNKSPIQLAY